MRLPVMWLCEYLCLPVQFSGENEKETCRKQLLLKKGKRKVVFLKKKILWFGGFEKCNVSSFASAVSI